MSRRLIASPVLKSATVIAALAAFPLAQAASVQTVFSAENALYGAGYNIGQADGWIDENLRKAVRQYQNDRPDLKVTGELDSKTLSALGISDRSSQLLGGNTASSRSAAMKELGLVAAAPPRPDPEPEPKQRALEPETTPEPAPIVVASVTQETQSAPKPEVAPEPALQRTQKPVETPEPEPQVANARPEPVQSEPQPQPETAEAEPTSEPIVMVSASRESRVEASEKPSVPETVASESPAERDGKLSKMFDFLFGWMV